MVNLLLADERLGLDGDVDVAEFGGHHGDVDDLGALRRDPRQMLPLSERCFGVVRAHLTQISHVDELVVRRVGQRHQNIRLLPFPNSNLLVNQSSIQS